MNKINLLLFFCLAASLSFGQKKEYYANDDFYPISKAEYETKYDHDLGYTMRFESDTAITYLKVSRIKRGNISLSLLDSIKTALSENGKRSITTEDALFINYYPGKQGCSHRNYKENFRKLHKHYYRKLEKEEHLKQFFIYKSNEGIEGFGKLIEWQNDVDQLIQNTFFLVDYPCGGYVIIKNDGTFISQRGEYCYSESLIAEIKSSLAAKTP